MEIALQFALSHRFKFVLLNLKHRHSRILGFFFLLLNKTKYAQDELNLMKFAKFEKFIALFIGALHIVPHTHTSSAMSFTLLLLIAMFAIRGVNYFQLSGSVYEY